MFIVQGHSESDLNEAGKKQSQAVKFVAQLLKETALRCAVRYCLSVSVCIFLFQSLVIALSLLYGNGLQVAEKLANLRLEFAAIYSSDLRRAVDTAEAIAEKCQFRSKVRIFSILLMCGLENLQDFTSYLIAILMLHHCLVRAYSSFFISACFADHC